MKVILNVPFQEKDEAKNLGAIWDPARKTWYAKYGEEEKFFKWINEEKSNEFNIKANYFYIAESITRCDSCRKQTKVFSYFIDIYETLHVVEQFDGNENFKLFWIEEFNPSFISHISHLNQYAQMAMLDHSRNYRISERSKGFLNHCERCNAAQSEFRLHNEPGEAFCPVELSDIEYLKLYRIDQLFATDGTHSYSSLLEEVNLIDGHLHKPSIWTTIFKH